MSTLFVKVVKIKEVVEHGNADSLAIAKIAGWECVVRKGQFLPGDLAVYVPIDARIPFSLEERIFKDAKIKLDHGRIKTIKLRGRISQGLLISPGQVPEIAQAKEGDDVAEALGVTKYEPPEPGNSGFGPKSGKQRKHTPGFIKYTNIENIKWYNDAFTENDYVVMTEKLHGTSARYGLGPKEAKTKWQKIKKFFGIELGLELICGTRETEQNEDDEHSTWAKVARQYHLKSKLKPGEIVFGEIVGNGIQKNYDYSYAPGHHGFFVYDVAIKDAEGKPKFLDHDDLHWWCIERGLKMVPIYYVGPYSEQKLKEATEGASILDPNNPIREGTVVKPMVETSGPSSGRRVLKSINPEYALKKQTEFH